MVQLLGYALTAVAVRNAWRLGCQDRRLAGFRKWCADGFAQYEWRTYSIQRGDLAPIIREFARV